RSTTSTSSSSSSNTVGRSYTPGQVWEAIIETDPDTGSLIIIADEETNERIKQIVENLDRPMPQVLIKVVFLEVTHRDDLDYGVDALFDHGKNNTGNIMETAFGVGAKTNGGFYRIIDNDLDVTMRAIAEVGKTEVLSRPSVLARHNQEASITIGSEVPFIRNSRVTQDGQIINTVEYEDIGIILRVTPFITSKGLVEMVIAPEISTLTGETVPISDTIDAPIFAKRSAETRVVLPTGHTVVIGGLMEDNNTEDKKKVPILGSIPLLGLAFQRTIKENTKTELLIFLTPYVVEGPDQLAEMSTSEQNKAELVPKAFSDQQMKKYLDQTEKQNMIE
ncbi:MAG: hypothetical protein ABIH23_17075, partial [bacterium]